MQVVASIVGDTIDKNHLMLLFWLSEIPGSDPDPLVLES
jgi:hypothetical protein